MAELVRCVGVSAEVHRADTLEQIAVNAIGTGITQAVISSHQPGGRLRAAIAETGADNPKAMGQDKIHPRIR